MALPPRFEFRRRVRALDADAFEEFVADLWRARGWGVDRDGGTIDVEHPTLGDRRTLAVRTVPWWWARAPSPTAADAAADVVVVNRAGSGRVGSVVDVGDLYEMACYSVDPPTRRALYDAHLARPGSLAARAIRRVPPGPPIRLATAAVALSVLLAAVAGVSLLPGDDPTPALEDANGSVPSGDTGDASDVREPPDEFAATRWPGAAGGYPPGLAADGIADADAIASTHARRAAARPYELTLTVREFEDGRRVGSYRERIAVRNRWTFVSSIESSGELRSDHPTLSAVEVYSDGNGLYVHAETKGTADAQAALRASPGDVAGLHHRVERYLSSVLSTKASRVAETTQIGDTTFHRVVGTDGRPGDGGRNVSASVTAGGTVHAVRAERDVPETDRQVVVTLEYTFGPVIVDPPAWVGNGSVTVGGSFPISKR